MNEELIPHCTMMLCPNGFITWLVYVGLIMNGIAGLMYFVSLVSRGMMKVLEYLEQRNE